MKMRNLYAVKRDIPYEGYNAWVVVADDREQCRELIKGLLRQDPGYIDIDLISTQISALPEIIHSFD